MQLEIPCSGAEDFVAAQKVLKIMYSCKLDLEDLAEQLVGSPLIQVQLLTKVMIMQQHFPNFSASCHTRNISHATEHSVPSPPVYFCSYR
jgi:hypothetical protein